MSGGEEQLVLVFESTSHSMRAEKLATAHFRVSIIPTPTQITSGCGFALLMRSGTQEELVKFAEALELPCALYKMEENGAGGQRTAALLARHEGGGNI